MTKRVRRQARLEALEVGEEGLPKIALKGEAGKFAFALDGDEAGGFELVEMMGERGGGDGHGFSHIATGSTALAGAKAFEDLEAARIGERFEDGEALPGGDGLR
jgi:hypothetical protein